MKSNEERVSSIKAKAKKYKSERGAILSTTALTICAVIAVFTQVTFDKTNTNVEKENSGINIAINQLENNDENLKVASLNDNISTFNSKDELIELLEKRVKKYEVDRNEMVAFDDIAIGTAEANGTPFNRNDVQKEAVTEGSSYSETNTQVQGVDEADIVKTNGKYIYYLKSYDNSLKIFNTQNDDIILEKEINLGKDSYAYNMYLDDNYIVVLTNGIINKIMDDGNDLEKQKKIAYDYYGKSSTKVLIYDVNTYELLREVETEGNMISSRKIGDDVYVITNRYINFYEGINSGDILPLYKDTCQSGEYEEIPVTSINYFKDLKDDEECNYMIITSFDLGDMNSKVNVDTYLGAGTEVYCSKESLYVAKVNYNYNIFARIGILIDSVANYEYNTTTSIHKFAIKDGGIKYVATGKVDGSLLNQFSMDEYDGCFRITTTSNSDGNNLFVLDEQMKQIGSVENLASGERIYATRFMGDKAYVVTYKTVDPLFVIDLSNPKAPKVLGELKIPGYSSYLHPLGENYLIGFGEDSVEKSYINWEGKQQVIAYATGLKMAIFDVSDYSNPKEIHSIKIGARGSYSELLYNHKALLFNEEEGIIAFPATVTKEAGTYDNGVPMYGDVIFIGALVYDISAEDGISLRGKISHGSNSKYNNQIQRIIYIGDKLYTVSDNMIKVSDMKSVEELDSLKF